MQKKIIALAVAGLVSGVAFAQTNVTIYGIIDMAYEHKSDEVSVGGGVRNAIDQGGWDGSRFGLKGTEDLGNGLSVSFQQEFRTRPDVNGSSVSQRPSFVTLAGKGWGSIKAGNFWNVVDDVTSGTSGGSGDQQGYGEGVIAVSLVPLSNNAVQFDSLDYSGFKFAVGYSSNMAYADDTASQSGNMRAWYTGANYSNGGLYVGATYMAGSRGLNDIDYDEWVLGASYDFKVAKVGLTYGDVTVEGDPGVFAGGADKLDRKTWRVNVSVPITAKDTVALSYVDSSLDRNPNLKDYDASAFGVSYSHALSKRTHLYAAAYTADADNGFLEVSPDGNIDASAYETAFKVGIRHKF